MKHFCFMWVATLCVIASHGRAHAMVNNQFGTGKETCQYSGALQGEYSDPTYGTFPFSGRVNAQTVRFKNEKTGQDEVRLLLSIDARSGGIRIESLVDQTAYFVGGDDNGLGGRLVRVDEASMTIQDVPFKGGIKYPRWRRTDFVWPDLHRAPETAGDTREIGAKDEKELQAKFPEFARRFLPRNRFGSDWMSEFENFAPVARPDLAVRNLPNDLSTPNVFAFVEPRFWDVMGEKDAHFYAHRRDGKDYLTQRFKMSYDAGTQLNLMTGDLQFGGVATDPNRPAVWRVDARDQSLKELELHLLVSEGRGKGRADTVVSLQGCSR